MKASMASPVGELVLKRPGCIWRILQRGFSEWASGLRYQCLLVAMGYALLALLVPAQAAGPASEGTVRGVGFEQHLGFPVAPALAFTDERGQAVTLGDYLRARPVVLAMGYYRCPMLCGIGLNGTARTLEEFPPESPSRDFEYLFVSIDPAENCLAAAAKKSEYLRKLGWPPAAERWHFLTGTGPAIAQLASQVGFHYRYDPGSNQYVHPSGLVVLSPEGKIASYLFGIDYPAPAFDRALANARRGEVGRVVDFISLLCFSHSPAPGSVAYYVLIALRSGSVLTLAGLVALIRSKRRTLPAKDAGA
ncbi:MAG TPA: SCO family protein [Chthoniobacterales bacterium]